MDQKEASMCIEGEQDKGGVVAQVCRELSIKLRIRSNALTLGAQVMTRS